MVNLKYFLAGAALLVSGVIADLDKLKDDEVETGYGKNWLTSVRQIAHFQKHSGVKKILGSKDKAFVTTGAMIAEYLGGDDDKADEIRFVDSRDNGDWDRGHINPPWCPLTTGPFDRFMHNIGSIKNAVPGTVKYIVFVDFDGLSAPKLALDYAMQISTDIDNGDNSRKGQYVVIVDHGYTNLRNAHNCKSTADFPFSLSPHL